MRRGKFSFAADSWLRVVSALLPLATLLMLPPGAWAQVKNGKAEPIWSAEPKRVDQKSQPFERLPAKPGATFAAPAEDRYPLKLNRALPVQVLDSISFVQQGKKYRLAGLDPVPVAKTCKNTEGERWACGLRSRIALSGLLRGRLIRCAPVGQQDGFTVVECIRNTKDIGGSIVSAGYALVPAGTNRYRAELDEARKERSGVWAEAQSPDQ